MREIKFRVWDKEDKNMSIPFDIFDFSQDESGFKWFGNTNVDDKENIVILQFTGLKDKNGKEIFEGDIINHHGFISKFIVTFGSYKRKNFSNHDRQVKHHGWYGEPISEFDDKTRIEWNDSIESLVNFRNGVEVIGNIYENPELLEDEE